MAFFLEIWEPQLPETLRACPSLFRHCITFKILLCRTKFSGTYLFKPCFYLYIIFTFPSVTLSKSLQCTCILPVTKFTLACTSSCLPNLNSVSDHASKFGSVTTGRQDLVQVLTSWVYVSYVCIVFNFELIRLI